MAEVVFPNARGRCSTLGEKKNIQMLIFKLFKFSRCDKLAQSCVSNLKEEEIEMERKNELMREL